MAEPVCVIVHPKNPKKTVRIYKSRLGEKYWVMADGGMNIYAIPFVDGLLSAQVKALELLGVKDE